MKVEINDELWNSFHSTVQDIRENATRESLRKAEGDTPVQQLAALVDDDPVPYAECLFHALERYALDGKLIA